MDYVFKMNMLKEIFIVYFKTIIWFGSIYILLRIPVYGFALNRYYSDIIMIIIGPMIYAIIVVLLGKLFPSPEEVDKENSTR